MKKTKILFVNPITYTPENKMIPKVDYIDNTMSYDLCSAFVSADIDITLAAAVEWKPLKQKKFPFEIFWMNSYLKNFFPIHRIPVNLGLIKHLKREKYDYVFTSEVFSIDSLLCVLFFSAKKTIVWHEMAMHNRMAKGLLSRVWYGIIAKIFFRKVLIVARSEEAQKFISQYCKNVSKEIIGHGVNLEKFTLAEEKQNCFCVVSQLIKRKRIDGILSIYKKYIEKYDKERKSVLYIIGDGDERESLENLTRELGIDSNVVFTGKLGHEKLHKYLSVSKAMLVNTEKDNSMISIVESIASGTPVITTTIPLNSKNIIKYNLGIAKDSWDENDLHNLDTNYKVYVENCKEYRKKLSTEYKVTQFMDMFKMI